MYGIDPHKHSISCQELFAHLVGELLVIDRRFGMDADIGKLLKDPVKPIVLGCADVSGFGIATPHDCDFEGLLFQAASLHASLLAWRVAQSLDGRLTGCLLDPAAMLSALHVADNPDPC